MNKFDDRSPWGKWKPRGIAKLSFSIIDRLPVNGLSKRLAFIFRKPVKNGRQVIFDREIWGLRLRLAVKGNLTEQRVRLFPYAVTATHEDVFVEAHSENIGQSGINSQSKGSKVRGVPLLDLLQEAEVDQVDAMKIDIEGMENPVLDAFFARAPNSLWPKLIIAETVGDCGARLRESLQAKGYKLEQQTKMNGIFRIT